MFANNIIATRLTCFALLTAVETDLRGTIRVVAEESGVQDFMPDDVQKNAVRRWTEDRKSSPSDFAGGQAELLEYTDFADLGKMLHGLTEQIGRVDASAVHLVASDLIDSAPARNRVCHSRPLEPDDFAQLFDLASNVSVRFKPFGCPEIRGTLQRLQTNPSFVLSLVIPSFWSNDVATVPNNLPLPEFDDTGFLGRDKDRKEVSRLLVSPHPVVTIVGEGGLGKTALALRCLFDMLELGGECRYDAVIWVSLKTKVLTAQGIEEIKDCIGSTLGLVQTIATGLGVPKIEADTPEALIEEIKEYMAHLRILLAVDNFETVSADVLRPLLSEIPAGSKVLITSRIGLGELELRYALEPMDIKNAVKLARRFGRSLNLRLISELREETLTKYCHWLHRNPLLIKWFVSSLAAGADPLSLVEKRGKPFDAVVRFCFENLFERLSEAETEVLQILASARRPLTQAELFFLTKDKPSDQVEWALNTLHHSNILKRNFESSSAKGDESSVGYYISEFASDYIDKFAPPSSAIFGRVQEALKKLREMSESFAAQRAAYKYDVFAVQADTRDQRICAAYLQRALSKLKAKDINGARNDVAEAKRLLPNYSEPYRLSGQIEADAGQLYAAVREFEDAERINPSSALAKYAFALFLARYMQDSDKALEKVECALLLDPRDVTLENFRALMLMRIGRLQEAAAVYEELLNRAADRGLRRRIGLADQAAECYRRFTEQDLRDKDDGAFEAHLGRALEIVGEHIVKNAYDDALLQRFVKIVNQGLWSATARRNLPAAELIVQWLSNVGAIVSLEHFGLHGWEDFFEEFRNDIPIAESLNTSLSSKAAPSVAEPVEENPQQAVPGNGDTHVDGGADLSGRVLRLRMGFGFIEDDDGHQYYFHRRSFRPAQLWQQLRRGDKVTFQIGRNKQGPCAINVRATR